jgi:hypothetical protein
MLNYALGGQQELHSARGFSGACGRTHPKLCAWLGVTGKRLYLSDEQFPMEAEWIIIMRWMAL